MIKYVRIENADTAPWKVKVTVQDRVYDPITQSMSDEWTNTKTFDLNYPTAMLNEYLTNTRRFIIEENGATT